MTSKIIQKEKSEQKLTYPVLMQDTNNDCVVLFYSETAGVVIDIGKSKYLQGDQCDYWKPSTDTAFWKKFEGIIELSNS